MRLWEHTSEELLALPMPDLALLVLADFKAGNGWNWKNWMIGATQSHGDVTRAARLKPLRPEFSRRTARDR